MSHHIGDYIGDIHMVLIVPLVIVAVLVVYSSFLHFLPLDWSTKNKPAWHYKAFQTYTLCCAEQVLGGLLF